MHVFHYTRLACQRRHETCAAVHDPIIIDDAVKDDVPVDYSPLVYALVTYADYLTEGDYAEVMEPEPYVEDPSEEWEEIEGTEPSESCVTGESVWSSAGDEPYSLATCAPARQQPMEIYVRLVGDSIRFWTGISRITGSECMRYVGESVVKSYHP